MVTKDATNWMLVGPWYRWPQPGVPASGRLTAPSLQKFAGNNFIPEFLAKPQHSLKFDQVVDVVNNFDLVQLDKTKWSRMLMVLNAKGDPASKDELKDTKDLYISRLAPSSATMASRRTRPANAGWAAFHTATSRSLSACEPTKRPAGIVSRWVRCERSSV